MLIAYEFSQSIEYCFGEHIMDEMRSLLPKNFYWNLDENNDIVGFYYEEEEDEKKEYVEDNIRRLIKGIYQEYSQWYGYNTKIRIFLEKNLS